MTDQQQECIPHTHKDTVWEFTIPIREEDDAAVLERTLSIFETVMAMAEGFIKPTQISPLVFPIDEERLTVQELCEVEHCNSLDMILAADSVIAPEEVTGAIRAVRGGPASPKIVTKIRLEETAVLFTTKSGKSWLDRSSPAFCLESEDTVAPDDPIWITIGCAARSTLQQYSVRVFTNSNIWFEDSQIGERNRERLAEFLEGLASRLDYDDVIFDSEVIWQSQLEDLGYDGLILH